MPRSGQLVSSPEFANRDDDLGSFNDIMGGLASFSRSPNSTLEGIFEAMGEEAQDDINVRAVEPEQNRLASQNQQAINRSRGNIPPGDRAMLRRRYGRYLSLEFSKILGDYYKKPENAAKLGNIKANLIAIDESNRSETMPYLGLKVKIQKQSSNLRREDFVPAFASARFPTEKKDDVIRDGLNGAQVGSRTRKKLENATKKSRIDFETSERIASASSERRNISRKKAEKRARRAPNRN